LLDWNRSLAIDDFIALLLDLKRVRATAGKPLVLIVCIRKEGRLGLIGNEPPEANAVTSKTADALCMLLLGVIAALAAIS